MKVYILHRYWDTPNNEGNEIMGAYDLEVSAHTDMVLDAAATKQYYSQDFWEDDMTWENEREIHLGSTRGTGNDAYATIYCWEIVEMEVQ